MPTSKLYDTNLQTLIEIINKQNAQTACQPVNAKKKSQSQFLPYNKSILTRVLHKQLRCNNLLVINHFSKLAIQKHLRLPAHQCGPAKGLFNTLIKLGYS